MWDIGAVTFWLTVGCFVLVLVAFYNTRKARRSLDELHRTYRR